MAGHPKRFRPDFGSLLPDPHDPAALLIEDFLLLHGDDWYVAALEVPTGALCWVDEVAVKDVPDPVDDSARRRGRRHTVDHVFPTDQTLTPGRVAGCAAHRRSDGAGMETCLSAIGENAALELYVRSRKSHAYLQ